MPPCGQPSATLQVDAQGLDNKNRVVHTLHSLGDWSKVYDDDKIISKEATNSIVIAATKWEYLVHLEN